MRCGAFVIEKLYFQARILVFMYAYLEGDLTYKSPSLLYLQTNHRHWLNEMAQLIDDGKMKVTISNVYPLEHAAEAHKESATWHVRGKLVLEERKEKQA